jgi:hypothetical protein
VVAQDSQEANKDFVSPSSSSSCPSFCRGPTLVEVCNQDDHDACTKKVNQVVPFPMTTRRSVQVFAQRRWLPAPEFIRHAANLCRACSIERDPKTETKFFAQSSVLETLRHSFVMLPLLQHHALKKCH